MNAKRILLPLSLTALLAGGGAVYWLSGVSLAPYAQAQASANAVEPLNETEAFLQDEANTVDIFKTYGPSVVAVNVEVSGQRVDPFAGQNVPPEFQQFFEQFGAPAWEQPPQRGAGSGFVIDRAGRLLTNYHVIQSALEENSVELLEGATLTVTFTGSSEELPVRVVGVNPSFDLALLELTSRSDLPEHVTPIAMADSDALEVGQKVIAIGNPFGLEATVTTGIISAVGRDFTSVGQFNFPVIQTDAAINPGNSGGPLLNSKGELIGVNTAIFANAGADGQAGSLGIGFAIPSNQVAENLAALEQGGYSTVYSSRPRMGAETLDISSYPEGVREYLGLPEQGQMVVTVEPGSPAADAGLQAASFAVTVNGQSFPAGGDVITEVDGEALSGESALQNIIFAKEPGDEIVLRVWRDGQEGTVRVTLEVIPLSS